MLIECPECNQQVSDKAQACPKCGHPIQPVRPVAAEAPKTPSRTGEKFLIALGAIAALATIGGLFQEKPHETDPANSYCSNKFATSSHLRAICEGGAGLVLPEETNAQKYAAAAEFIRLHGYDCPKAELLIKYMFDQNFYVYCNNGQYKFSIEDHGGKLSVTSQ